MISRITRPAIPLKAVHRTKLAPASAGQAPEERQSSCHPASGWVGGLTRSKPPKGGGTGLKLAERSHNPTCPSRPHTSGCTPNSPRHVHRLTNAIAGLYVPTFGNHGASESASRAQLAGNHFAPLAPAVSEIFGRSGGIGRRADSKSSILKRVCGFESLLRHCIWHKDLRQLCRRSRRL